ncbi:PP2C family protein-serine/threonine phosphatase [Streptomyces sp. JNUCC 63]
MIADVRGKGLGAVRTVNGLLGSFHEAATRVSDLPGVVGRLEERMRELNAEDAEGAESFATAVVLEISADGSVLRLSNLGHAAPLLVHQGRARPLDPTDPTLPLGLGDLGRVRVPVEQYPLPPGATLVLYTDGVVEARDRRGAFYDPVPPLSRPLPANPDSILDALLVDLARHTGGHLDDDAALMAVTHRQEAWDDAALSADQNVEGQLTARAGAFTSRDRQEGGGRATRSLDNLFGCASHHSPCAPGPPRGALPPAPTGPGTHGCVRRVRPARHRPRPATAPAPPAVGCGPPPEAASRSHRAGDPPDRRARYGSAARPA